MAVQEAVFTRPGVTRVVDHLGQANAARALLAGIERTLSDRTVRTRDLGGTATTQEMTEAVLAALPACGREAE